VNARAVAIRRGDVGVVRGATLSRHQQPSTTESTQ
jgi:hypothetical protein